MTDIYQLNIKKGFWFGAGSPKVFNWTKDDFHQSDVGIDERLLYLYDRIEITVCGKIYQLDTALAREFVARYDSYKMAKGTRLAVVSKSLLA